jgi:2-polyprenyl-3-methyl-5-hydroxy-6-metoxy-1,4-benzoquinol methylase
MAVRATREEVEQRRLAVIERWGPWIGYNVELGDGLFTIGPQQVGNGELRVARIAQAIRDLRGGSLEGTRVLDLGSHEGGFGIEMALMEADVVCVEARSAHIAKATFAKEVLGLDRLEIVQGDARHVDVERLGRFDVVLCLGLLYHLPSSALEPFLRALASMCTGCCVIETQISLRALKSFEVGGRTYFGRTYSENPVNLGAAVDAEDSFWLTRSSLLNLLSDVGFTSISELLTPIVTGVAEFEDHVTFIALNGEPVSSLSLPILAGLHRQRWPEAMRRRRHPTQERWARLPVISRLNTRRFWRDLKSRRAES